MEEVRKIVDNVDSRWSRDYIIRYLYRKLAPYFRRDVKYFLASEEKKLREYQAGFINRGRDIVCSTLADFYVRVFEEFGIRAEKVVATSSKIPLFAVVVLGDNGYYFLDPLNDLFENQYGLRTKEFGKVPRYKTLKEKYPNLEFLSDSYIDSLDKELGFDETLDDYFFKLHLRMTERSRICEYFGVDKNDKLGLFEARIKYASDNLINIGKVDGPLERIRLYLFLERMLFFKSEKNNIRIKLIEEFDSLIPEVSYLDKYGERSTFIEEKTSLGYQLKKTKSRD